MCFIGKGVIIGAVAAKERKSGEFTLRIIGLIRAIPRSKVTTYGRIAAAAGDPHRARQVAWILHSSSAKHGLPWQRVIGSRGRISLPEKGRAGTAPATGVGGRSRRRRRQGGLAEIRLGSGAAGEPGLGRFEYRKTRYLAKVFCRGPSAAPLTERDWADKMDLKRII
jgi:methylated-DNA-protein-cysteine methyltransferase-like protein